MDTIRFNKNVKLIKSFMDRLWVILPTGLRPEWKEDRQRDSIELWLRNYNDHIYTKRYLRNVSYRPPEEIMLDVTIWATRYIVETYAGEKKLQNSWPQITKVIFNGPATIVFWSDGTKTVVKCDDDEFFDREKGIAMAISKKALGNKGNYYNEFRKWIDTEDQNKEPKVHIKTDYETMETVVRIDGMSDANSFENLANILLEKLKYCTYGGDHK